MSVLDRDGRKVALGNLEVAFGDRFSQREREQIARESFQNFEMIRARFARVRVARNDPQRRPRDYPGQLCAHRDRGRTSTPRVRARRVNKLYAPTPARV